MMKRKVHKTRPHVTRLWAACGVSLVWPEIKHWPEASYYWRDVTCLRCLAKRKGVGR